MKNLEPIPYYDAEAYRREALALALCATEIAAGKWCQFHTAVDADGNPVDLMAAHGEGRYYVDTERFLRADCFCAGGYLDFFTPHSVLGLNLLDQCMNGNLHSVPSWNDRKGRKPYQVARLFRAAAARADRWAEALAE